MHFLLSTIEYKVKGGSVFLVCLLQMGQMELALKAIKLLVKI